MPGPLAGVKVLDLTTVVMGPFCTQILAELGAEVIKVESHDGDNMREVGPMRNRSMGHLYLHLNRGKRCIVLDLKRPEGREVVTRLLPKVDVLVYNVRPQAMARLGLSYDDVRAANPRIIYVGTYGYSQRGPYAAKAAYDDLIQGISGLPMLNSDEDDGRPHYVPVNLADRVTGLHAVYAVTAALYARERTGQGQSVEVPMFESIAHFVLGDHLAGLSWAPPIGEPGYARLRHRRPYATRDGYLCVLVYNDKQWRAFLEAVGRADLMQDPRFFPHAARARHIGELYEFLDGLLRTRTTAQWVELLDKIDIPVAPVSSIEDLVHDRHLSASAFFGREAHPTEGEMLVPRTPTAWSGTPPAQPAPSPRLGADSAQILRELGYSDEQIAALGRSGVTLLAG
jgi:crotonobetainyl-CoA:carnitine CoA-transferase CaiB-like acyl-CoA transferase